jgi:hypothetical protein
MSSNINREEAEMIVLLPMDLQCPAISRCGGYLLSYGIENGVDEKPTVKYFVCSNRNCSEHPCPANPMMSKFDGTCKACKKPIRKVIYHFIIKTLDQSINLWKYIKRE